MIERVKTQSNYDNLFPFPFLKMGRVGFMKYYLQGKSKVLHLICNGESKIFITLINILNIGKPINSNN